MSGRFIWMIHCHNTYHQDAGIMTGLKYTNRAHPVLAVMEAVT